MVDPEGDNSATWQCGTLLTPGAAKGQGMPIHEVDALAPLAVHRRSMS